MKRSLVVVLLSLGIASTAAAQTPAARYVFGEGASAGATVVSGTASAYDPARGYGLEGADAVRFSRGVQSPKPFFFSAKVPEGNHKVTVVLGGDSPSVTTVKSELRRLSLDQVAVPAGGSVTRTFIVNTRTPAFTGGAVRLKGQRESVQEAVAWDNRLTLEFNGTNPAVRSITIESVDVPTIYILGDSTSTDQGAEPYASWGQMFTGLFQPTVAVSNHGESGESVGASIAAGRFKKILDSIKPGDVFMVQFGHNDMKEVARNPAAPTQYRDNLISWAKAIQAKGATAVIITPVNRHTFTDGKVTDSLAPYPQMAKDAAAATGSPVIDLNAMSKPLYEALGEEGSWALFKHDADGSNRDGTHHNNYGAYEIAKLVAQGMRDAKLPIASHLRKDLPKIDPAKPSPLARFTLPMSPTYTDQRPLGD
jgi:lysophospholipase L1-like esterase